MFARQTAGNENGFDIDTGESTVTFGGPTDPVAQLDSASVSGAEGYRFEPCRGRFSYAPGV
jgi:hypothetical protein